MKKISVALIAFIAILGFSNCTKNNTTTTNNAYSTTYSFKGTDWVPNTSNQKPPSNSWSIFATVPEIDNDGTQAILAYIKYDGNAGFEALPEEFAGISYNVIHSNNNLEIEQHTIDGSNYTPTTTLNGVIKVVIIDAAALKSSGVNIQNYSAVKAAFHLN